MGGFMRKLIILTIFIGILILINAEHIYSELDGYYCDIDLQGYYEGNYNISVCDSLIAFCNRNDVIVINTKNQTDERVITTIPNAKASDVELTSEYLFFSTDDTLFAVSFSTSDVTPIYNMGFYRIDMLSGNLLGYNHNELCIFSSEYPFNIIDSMNIYSHEGIIQNDDVIIVGDSLVTVINYDGGNLKLINEYLIDSLVTLDPIGIHNNIIFFDHIYIENSFLLNSEILAYELINDSCLFRHRVHIQETPDNISSYSILMDSVLTCVTGISTYNGLRVYSYNTTSGFHLDEFNSINQNISNYCIVDSSIFFINSEIGIMKYNISNNQINDLDEYYSLIVSPYEIYFTDNFYMDVEKPVYSNSLLVRILNPAQEVITEIESSELLIKRFNNMIFPVRNGDDVILLNYDDDMNIRYMPISIFIDSVHTVDSFRIITNQGDEIIDYTWDNENIYLLGDNAVYRIKAVSSDSVVYIDNYSAQGSCIESNGDNIVIGNNNILYLLNVAETMVMVDSIIFDTLSDISELRIDGNTIRTVAGSKIITIEISDADELNIIDEFTVNDLFLEINLQENYFIAVQDGNVNLYSWTNPGYLLSDSLYADNYNTHSMSVDDSQLVLYTGSYPATYSIERYRIEEVLGISKFNNPSDPYMDILFNKNGLKITVSDVDNRGTLSIYDIQGREIQKYYRETVLIGSNELNSGVYFPVYRSGKRVIKGKFVIF